MKPERREILIQSQKRLKRLLQITQDLLDDKISQRQAAKELGVSYSTINQSLTNGITNTVYQLPIFESNQLKQFLLDSFGPYTKLAYDVLNIPKDSDQIFIISQKMVDVLKAGINKYLTPKSRDIIQTYYGLNDKPKQTLEQIAQTYEESRANIHAFKQRAIKRLRKPDILNVLLDNYPVHIESKAKTKGHIQKTTLPDKFAKPDKPIKDYTLDDLHPSNRLRNALIDNHVTTLKDILSHSEQDYLNMPGIGHGSLNELRTKLAAIKLTLKLN